VAVVSVATKHRLNGWLRESAMGVFNADSLDAAHGHFVFWDGGA